MSPLFAQSFSSRQWYGMAWTSFVKPLDVWQNYPELTLALQVFSYCEVSTDMINNQMPGLEKFVNRLHDVTDADATAVEAFRRFLFVNIPSLTCRVDMYGATFHILCSLWLLVNKQHKIFVVSLSLDTNECSCNAVFMGGGKGSIVQGSHAVASSSVGNLCAR